VVFLLQALAAPGASANVDTATQGNLNFMQNANVSNATDQPVALATNGALELKIATRWAAAGTGTNNIALMQFIVEALN
jgi:hypothetical protein